MRIFSYIFLLALASMVDIQRLVAQPAPERPVVLIPGILGSKLCERATGKTVWGDRWSYSNFSELALPAQFNPDQLPHTSCGLIDSVNILGPFQVHQYDDLLHTLGRLGYRENANLFVFDYDWRLSNRVSADKLNSFLQQKIPTGQFDIVAHSMGGVVAKVWMADYGGASRVGALVTFGTPHLGSASTFRTLDEGWGFWKNMVARGLGQVRETAMTFPSLYELLPSYPRCCGFRSNASSQPDYFNPFTASVWQRFRWMPASFASPERRAWLQRTLTDASAIVQIGIPPGPKVITVVNSLIPTAWRVIFDPVDGRMLTYINQPGDGTVYQNSAANNHLEDARPALTKHQTIFADDAARQVLSFVLIRGPEPVKGVLSTIKARLRTQTGGQVGVVSVSAEIDPPVLEPGQKGRFVVELTGEQALLTADLSNIRPVVDGSTPVSLLPPDREFDPDPAGNVLVRLAFPLEAPTELGSFSVTVNLPGIAELTDNAIVVPK
jgi:pimeloyl-ACP methyl ester carboxylesterase